MLCGRRRQAVGVAVVLIVAACGTSQNPSTSPTAPGEAIGSAHLTPNPSASATLDPMNGRGLRILQELGFPVAAATTSTAPDSTTGRLLATTTGYDGSGARVATLEVDVESGLVRSLVSFGEPDRSATPPPLTAADVAIAARDFLARAGLMTPTQAPAVTWDESLLAWQADWPRTIDGVPAEGDGTRVWLLGAERLLGLSHLGTPAAPTPVARITAEAATATARVFLASRPIKVALITDVRLRWALPNDAVGPLPSGISARLLRLVYTVSYRVPQADGTNLEGAVLVDVGSGQLVGALDVS